MHPVYIYALNDPVTGQTRYIGKTIDIQKRLKKHIQNARKEKCHRAYWVCSLLDRGLRPEIEMLAQIPEPEWQKWETDYIAYFHSMGFNLTNTTAGGEGGPLLPETCAKIRAATLGVKNHNFGKHFSFETRAKISVARKGFKHTPETCEKMRLARLGKRHTTETRLKIAAGNSGKTFSPETRSKISAAQLGEKSHSFGKRRSLETRSKMCVAQSQRREKEKLLCLPTKHR